MLNWLELLEIKLPILTASLMGAIAALTFEDKVSFLRACGIISCGATASTYANPVIMEYFHFPQSYGNAVAFMVGLVAMKMANPILLAVSKLNADFFISLILRNHGPSKSNDSKSGDRTDA